MQNRAATSTRERKINRIYSYLDELAASEDLKEEYIDDLLDVVQQYNQMVAIIIQRRME